MKRETQATITAWAAETFGPATPLRILGRANEEAAELVRHLTADPRHAKAAEEAADTVIALYRAATMLGFDLADEAVRFYEPDRLLTIADEARRFHEPNRLLARNATPLRAAVFAGHKLLAAVEMVEVMPPGALAPRELRDALGGAASWLAKVVQALGGDLLNEIDAKMAVNRKREWNVRGDGTGYHVRAGSAAAERLRAGVAEIAEEVREITRTMEGFNATERALAEGFDAAIALHSPEWCREHPEAAAAFIRELASCDDEMDEEDRQAQELATVIYSTTLASANFARAQGLSELLAAQLNLGGHNRAEAFLALAILAGNMCFTTEQGVMDDAEVQSAARVLAFLELLHEGRPDNDDEPADYPADTWPERATAH